MLAREREESGRREGGEREERERREGGEREERESRECNFSQGLKNDTFDPPLGPALACWMPSCS